MIWFCRYDCYFVGYYYKIQYNDTDTQQDHIIIIFMYYYDDDGNIITNNK